MSLLDPTRVIKTVYECQSIAAPVAAIAIATTAYLTEGDWRPMLILAVPSLLSYGVALFYAQRSQTIELACDTDAIKILGQDNKGEEIKIAEEGIEYFKAIYKNRPDGIKKWLNGHPFSTHPSEAKRIANLEKIIKELKSELSE
jgi:Zn-dependent protease with chaperone function